MNATATLFMTVAALVGPTQQPPRSVRPDPYVNVPASLVLLDEVDVPAPEAGILDRVDKIEGQATQVDEVVAHLDDRQVLLRARAAELRVKAAETALVTADAELKAGIESANVALTEVSESRSIVEENPYAIPQLQLRRERLTAKRAQLQAVAAESRLEQTQFERDVAEAELAEANHMITQRSVICPIAGEVAEVLKKRGEWVQPGEAVYRVVRMDRLRVEVYLDMRDIRPDEAAGTTVQVQFDNLSQPISSRITFVDPRIRTDFSFKAWAEIDNQRSPVNPEQWALYPGQPARLKVVDRGRGP